MPAFLTSQAGMPSNPYNRPKEQIPRITVCELCDRSLNTKDWNAHKNSKKHRAAEDAEKAKENAHVNSNGFDGFGGEASGFTPEAGFDLPSTDSGNGGWGSSGGFNIGNDFGSSNYGNKTSGGGGDRACFGCGETGHTKRDCPKGGSSGGDRACFGCGEVGHTKRDCPKGGSSDRACFGCGEVGHTKRDCPKGGSGGGGQACFNCGLEGYVFVPTD